MDKLTNRKEREREEWTGYPAFFLSIAGRMTNSLVGYPLLGQMYHRISAFGPDVSLDIRYWARCITGYPLLHQMYHRISAIEPDVSLDIRYWARCITGYPLLGQMYHRISAIRPDVSPDIRY